MPTGLIVFLSILGVMFAVIVVGSIMQINAHNKYIEDNTYRKYTADQTRELLAEKLGVKVTQIKFRSNESGFYGISIMSEEFSTLLDQATPELGRKLTEPLDPQHLVIGHQAAISASEPSPMANEARKAVRTCCGKSHRSGAVT